MHLHDSAVYICICIFHYLIILYNYYCCGWKVTVTTLITVLGDTKWLLKVIRFAKYVFKLKIEPMPMCICPCFHNKLKRLEYLRWHPMCLMDWVYLLRILNSHYLFICLHKHSSIRDRRQVCGRVLGFLQTVECRLESSTWNSNLSVKVDYWHLMWRIQNKTYSVTNSNYVLNKIVF